MLDGTDKLLRDPGTELVFGLVAPVGADLERLEVDLIELIGQYGYSPNVIRLSALLRKVPGLGIELKDAPEVDRINSYMDAGNAVRERSKSEELLAAWALVQIRNMRSASQPVLPRTAHILRSIKHPAEARALRAVYGSGFYLIGLSASTVQKVKYLKQKGLTDPEAYDVIGRDAGEENHFGQQTREAFELADVFIRQEPDHRKTTAQLARFLRLMFGAIDETPTSDEHAMFLAYASSLRSADLSRQVGAVVWKDRVGVVGTGCNDVPAAGGGLYWPGPTDHRDHALGHDAQRAAQTRHCGRSGPARSRRAQAPARAVSADCEGVRRNAAPRHHRVWSRGAC